MIRTFVGPTHVRDRRFKIFVVMAAAADRSPALFGFVGTSIKSLHYSSSRFRRAVASITSHQAS